MTKQAMAAATMLLALTISASCRAVGPDSCWLQGRVGARVVKLSYVDDTAYGLEADRTYGYCRMGAKGESTWFMRCSATPDGKTTVYYETFKSDEDADNHYVCRTGCSKKVVKVFKLDCEAGC